jgi:hypothetical protein
MQFIFAIFGGLFAWALNVFLALLAFWGIAKYFGHSGRIFDFQSLTIWWVGIVGITDPTAISIATPR